MFNFVSKFERKWIILLFTYLFLLFLSYLRLSNAESLCLNIPWRDWFRAEYKHLRASPYLTPVSTPHSVECPSVRRRVVTVTSRQPRTVVPATSARRTGRTPAPAKARPRPVSRPRPRSMLELQTKVRGDFTITGLRLVERTFTFKTLLTVKTLWWTIEQALDVKLGCWQIVQAVLLA